MLNLHSRTAKACHMQWAVAGKTMIFAYIYVGGANCHIAHWFAWAHWGYGNFPVCSIGGHPTFNTLLNANIMTLQFLI